MLEQEIKAVKSCKFQQSLGAESHSGLSAGRFNLIKYD
jgi:hypothetical protein